MKGLIHTSLTRPYYSQLVDPPPPPPSLAAPVITDFPEGPCTEPTLFVLDDTDDEEFPCTAFGVPAPTVEWRCEAENCVSHTLAEQ